jgi:ribosomal protein L40E
VSVKAGLNLPKVKGLIAEAPRASRKNCMKSVCENCNKINPSQASRFRIVKARAALLISLHEGTPRAAEAKEILKDGLVIQDPAQAARPTSREIGNCWSG